MSEMRAYRATVRGFQEVSIVFGNKAGQARYAVYAAASEAGYQLDFGDVRVVRAPEFDELVAHPDWRPRKCWSEECARRALDVEVLP